MGNKWPLRTRHHATSAKNLSAEEHRDWITKVRYALLAISVMAVTYGIIVKEYGVVLAKGIRTCLECIGIA